jgi:translocation and assembly module TamB
MARRILVYGSIALAALFLLLVAAALLLPYWLPAVGRPVAERFGVTFGEYERLGYDRFAVRELRIEQPGALIRAERVEATTPLVWWWRLRGEVPETAYAAFSGWTVELRPQPPRAEPGAPSSIPTVVEQIEQIVGEVARWAPAIDAENGRVVGPDFDLEIPRLRLRYPEIGGAARLADWPGLVEISGEIPSDQPIRLSARYDPEELQAEVRLSRGEGTVEVGVEASWMGNPASGWATFGDSGLLPQEAEAQAANWRVPGERVGLAGIYETIEADAAVTWRRDRFQVRAEAAGEPVENAPAGTRPLRLQARASGDTERIEVEMFEADGPGVQIALASPVELDRSGRLLSESSALTARVDLAEQPWLQAAGMVSLDAQLRPGDEGLYPIAVFQVRGERLEIEGFALSRAEIEGDFAWPIVRATGAYAETGDGERIQISGSYHINRNAVSEVQAEATVSRAGLGRFAPEAVAFERLVLTGRADGPVGELSHSGEARVAGLQVEGMRPMEVELSWHAMAARFHEIVATAAAGSSRLAVTLGLDLDGSQIVAELRELVLVDRGAERLRLREPSRISLNTTGGAFDLTLQPLSLSGSEASLYAYASVSRGSMSELEVKMEGLRTEWINGFLDQDLPQVVSSRMNFSGQWNDGPLVFSLEGEASVVPVDEQSYEAVFRLRGDAAGVVIERLDASFRGQILAEAAGTLPASVHPWAAKPLQLNHAAPLKFRAETLPQAPIWADLNRLTGFDLRRPSALITLEGTLERPRGVLEASVQELTFHDPERPLPTLRQLEARATLDADQIRLENLALLVEGQPVRAWGTLPLGEAFWRGLGGENLLPNWENADLRLEIDHAQLAPFARFAPEMLAPQGRLDLSLHYRPGPNLFGTLRVTDGGTRPFLPFGSLQDVRAHAVFQCQSAVLRDLSGEAGGERVSIEGEVTSIFARPQFTVRVRGNNIPLVRQAGLIVRSNLDLRVVSQEEGHPQITGRLRLRDSLFLTDTRALLPGGTRGPAQRPPYFSVTAEPFAHWNLNVSIEGQNFLTVRTPVFNGNVSARFNLRNTLADPIAVGEATISEGRAVFPFASFAVERGLVQLTIEDPFEPQLEITGEARRFGYDLRMELTGTAEDPLLTFSSNPPLASEAILLMVMAGELPEREIAFSAQQRATALGAYLGRSLFAGPGDGDGLLDRLTITSGERISRQGRETYHIELELNDRWSLIGEYDEFDAYNAGVRWRIFSGRRRAAEDVEEEESDGR